MTKLRLNLALILTMFCALVSFAQQDTNVPIAIKPAGVVDLPADVAAQVKTLREAFDSVTKDEQLVAARKAQIQALLAAQFNRACAKLKVDPDAMEWVEDLSGIRPKSKGKP